MSEKVKVSSSAVFLFGDYPFLDQRLNRARWGESARHEKINVKFEPLLLQFKKLQSS